MTCPNLTPVARTRPMTPMRPMPRGTAVTPLAGGLVEAWDELRLQKLRVRLSLIGVAIAVLTMTTVTAVIGIM